MQKRDVILFIDDEKICHTLVELIIPNFTSYKLVGAYTGSEAINLAKRYANNLVLVLSDIILPDINGYEIYNEIKKDHKLKEVPFIFQSGISSQENELEKHVGQKAKILYKPYKQTELLSIIEETIDSN
jgi:CheY-like chemotaxis protein